MGEPRIKPFLQSALFTVNPPRDIQAKLAACLASDGAHIQTPKTGAEVAFIQQALEAVRKNIDARIPEITDKPGFFGPTTKNAVHVYKSTRTPPIIRQGRPLDDIVGRMTISSLDDDMTEIEGPKPVPPPTPASRFNDVVVEISGFGGINSPVQGQEQGSGVLRALVESAAYKAKTGRTLTTIKFTGGQNPDPTATIANKVRAALLVNGASVGLVCLFGGSAGGKNVLSLAGDLNGSGLRVALAYVGVSDGAFGDADAVAPPNSNADNLLIAVRTPFSANEKANIFQSAGNDTEFSGSLLRKIWAGKMPNKEVHGKIAGFPPGRDLTAEGLVVDVGPLTNFETIHATAVSLADAVHVARIRFLLDQAAAKMP